MKKLHLFDKLMFLLNVVVAILLLLAYILPYVEPKRFAFLSVLSLTMPFFIIANLLFILYWLLKLKKQVLLSLIVLLVGFKHLVTFYKFSRVNSTENIDAIAVMNYNVRLFNLFDWIPDIDASRDISTFINDKMPDIISMQEYRPNTIVKALKDYRKFEHVTDGKIKNGQAIFSKFPIINTGVIEFPHTYNNAIFVDIVRDNDTIRVYNVHLQSLKIDMDLDLLKMETPENLFARVGKTFSMQQDQTEMFLEHKRQSPYKTIICGDFNNTAYSYAYREITRDMKDAFVEAGRGFGRSYDFKFFPIRIDYVLVDEHFEVADFETFDVELSDHFPIMGRVRIK